LPELVELTGIEPVTS